MQHSTELSIQELAIVLLEIKLRERKELLEGSLYEFIKFFFPIVNGHEFIFKQHHYEIIEKLEQVYAGDCNRLVINIPPGYGKTELVVVLFCAWCYAKTADCRFLHLSYSADLTANNSLKIKDIINTEEFQELWEMEFMKELNGKERWKTKRNGEFRAASTGGAVTGFRAGRLGNEFKGALIIDDPIKPEDAESDVLRKKMNQRINNTVKSRLADERVPVILIMQRVHDDDVAGFLLSGRSGDEYEVLSIKAIQVDSEGNEYALWAEKDSLRYLQKFRLAAPYEFSSQYQQNPVPDDGVFFTRDSFNWYDLDLIPEGEDFGSGDYATTKDAGDFTELGTFRVTHDNKIYIRDWWSGQETSDVWIESQIDLAQKYGIKMWAGETGSIKQSIEPFLKRRMLERRVFFGLEWFSHAEASKEQNARGFQALVQSGRVYLPRGEPWAEELVHQLCRFPRAKFDDKVDACSLFAKMINKLWANKAVVPTDTKPKENTIDDIIADMKRRKRKSTNSRARI